MKEEQSEYLEQEAIKLNEVRDFGKIIGVPFTFFRQEFKLLSKAILFFAGPFLLIAFVLQSFFVSKFISVYAFNFNRGLDTIGYALLYFLFFVLAFSMAGTVVNSYLVLYAEKGKDNFGLNEVWEMTRKNFFRMLGSQIAIFFVAAIGYLLCFLPGIYLHIALSFVFIAMLNERISFGEAFKRSFEIIKGEWWFVFGTIIVLAIVFALFSFILSIPAYLFNLGTFMTDSKSELSVILLYLLKTLNFIFYLFAFAIQTIMTVFIYFSLREDKERPGLLNRIQSMNTGVSEKKQEEIHDSPENIKNRFLSDDNYTNFNKK